MVRYMRLITGSAWCILCFLVFTSCTGTSDKIPDPYLHVDQVIWVVADVDRTLSEYAELGFTSTLDLGVANVVSDSRKDPATVRIVRANLAGALVNWIQPLEGECIFREFHSSYGDGAMSLVHRFNSRREMKGEINRLKGLGTGLLETVTLETTKGDLKFHLMDTRPEGKYILGFVSGDDPMNIKEVLNANNRHGMKINQYAFAIREADPVSRYWGGLGLPEFQINHPELGDTHYYGKLVDHELIQGWQRHGDVAYEWCIPVKLPIVYEDHIRKHGEGIHHLAFTVQDMDEVLEDYRSRGFVVSMGGTWGEKGKPGSGRYEYIDLDKAGGVTMELLWNYKEGSE